MTVMWVKCECGHPPMSHHHDDGECLVDYGQCPCEQYRPIISAQEKVV